MNLPDRTGISEPSHSARGLILDAMLRSPVPPQHLLSCLGLYTRSVMLAKTLYLDEIYRSILGIPGIVVEFGSWWGGNMALFSSLRSIYEPYNHRRSVVGFDTFSGYPESAAVDGEVFPSLADRYGTTPGYAAELGKILSAHESDNFQSHIKKFDVVEGNVEETAPEYFESRPATVVALAYFDMALYAPTRAALEAVRPRLIPGSVLSFDEFGSDRLPGETLAIRDTLRGLEYEVVKSRHLHDRTALRIVR